MMGIEPMTSSLPRKRSTPELHRQRKSGRRDSDPRPSAWKADALPTELLPHIYQKTRGESRIRTYEVIRQQIYSLPQLATLVSPHTCNKKRTYINIRADGRIRTPDLLITNQLLWPAELHRHQKNVRSWGYPPKSVCKCINILPITQK